jgi:MFS transporter, ACS family, aldohexuronate transporter
MTSPEHRNAIDWRMWLPSTVLMLSTLLSYVDRQTLAVLSPTILHDTGLSAGDYGDVGSAFQFAYMIANPLWGAILDYVGLRRGMLAAVSLWTVASVSHAWVGGFWGFAIARTLLGLGEGATFPGGFRTATDSLPADRQGRGMALAYSGASLGAIITPLLVTPIALRFGWRAAFLVTGAFGAAWLALWLAVGKPPLLAPHRRAASLKFQWPDIRERRLWLIFSSFGLGAVALGVVSQFSPLYLNRVLGRTQAELAWIVWIPFAGWEVGYFFWGWVADRYLHGDMRRAARVFLLLAILALPEALLPLFRSWPPVVALFCWAMFVADGFAVTTLRVAGWMYPREQTALAAGIGSGAWSAVLVVVLPICGRLFDLKQYGAIFIAMGLLPTAGTALWFWLSRTSRKIEDQGATAIRVSTADRS